MLPNSSRSGPCFHNDASVTVSPVAASMAYGLRPDSDQGVWLVFDFGGGTFDAALVTAAEGIIKVVDTEGDNHLGLW